jgi:hypothetical protein
MLAVQGERIPGGFILIPGARRSPLRGADRSVAWKNSLRIRLSTPSSRRADVRPCSREGPDGSNPASSSGESIANPTSFDQRAARDQPFPIASFPHAQIVWVKQHFTLSRGHYHWQPTAVALWSHRPVAPLSDSPGPQEKEGLQPPFPHAQTLEQQVTVAGRHRYRASGRVHPC